MGALSRPSSMRREKPRHAIAGPARVAFCRKHRFEADGGHQRRVHGRCRDHARQLTFSRDGRPMAAARAGDVSIGLAGVAAIACAAAARRAARLVPLAARRHEQTRIAEVDVRIDGREPASDAGLHS